MSATQKRIFNVKNESRSSLLELFSRFEKFNFDEDEQFQSGLLKISPDSNNYKVNTNLLKIKAFYYSNLCVTLMSTLGKHLLWTDTTNIANSHMEPVFTRKDESPKLRRSVLHTKPVIITPLCTPIPSVPNSGESLLASPSISGPTVSAPKPLQSWNIETFDLSAYTEWKQTQQSQGETETSQHNSHTGDEGQLCHSMEYHKQAGEVCICPEGNEEIPNAAKNSPDLALAALVVKKNSPDLTLAAPVVKKNSPDLTLAAPVVKKNSPDLALTAPVVKKNNPDLTLAAPVVKKNSPALALAALVVKKNSPALAAPVVKKNSPDLALAAPVVKKNSPALAAPVVKKNSPALALAAPVVKKNSPDLALAAPVVKKNSPDLALAAPVVKESSQEENCSSVSFLVQETGSGESILQELSLVEIAELIQSEKPLPGLKQIEVTPTNNAPTPSRLARAKKPWEI